MKESIKQFRVIGSTEVEEAKKQNVNLEQDKYLEKVKKYIPTEVVLAYVFLQQSIENSTIDAGSFWTKDLLLGVIFFLCLTVTPIYKYMQLNDAALSKPIRQLVISTLAFIVWVFYFGDWFEGILGKEYYSPILATILMVTFTLTTPILEYVTPKKKVPGTIALLVISFMCFGSYSQTAKDLLRNGKQNKSGEFYFNQNLECYFKDSKPKQFFELSDSALIEVPTGYVVYLKAYNPLHVGYTLDYELVPDPINQVAVDFFGDVISEFEALQSFEGEDNSKVRKGSLTIHNTLKLPTENSIIIRLKELGDDVQKIVQQDLGIKLSKQLIALEFQNADKTRSDVEDIRKKADSLETQLSNLKNKLDSTQQVLLRIRNKRTWISPEWLTDDGLNRISLELLEVVKKHQQIEVNLEKLLSHVEKPLKEWMEFESTEKVVNKSQWFIGIKKTGDIDKKSIEVITLKKVLHPVKIKGDQLVVATDSTVKTVTYRLRKRQLVVFEASAGFAFSPQDQSDFVTAKNDAGELIVGSADSKQLEQINVTSMLNLNFNVWKDETVLPFLQLGVGLNEDIPLALFGGGLRFDFGENRIFALSTGVSFTGIKALTDLVLGGEVKDALTLENDLRYQVSAPKIYFGIQFNF